jgi:hypothetical protein
MRVPKGTVERDETVDDEWKLRAAFAEARRRVAARLSQPSPATAGLALERRDATEAPGRVPAAARAERDGERAGAGASEAHEWDALYARARASEEREWEELRARAHASEESEWRELRARADAAEARAQRAAATSVMLLEPAPRPRAEPGRVVFWP